MPPACVKSKHRSSIRNIVSCHMSMYVCERVCFYLELLYNDHAFSYQQFFNLSLAPYTATKLFHRSFEDASCRLPQQISFTLHSGDALLSVLGLLGGDEVMRIENIFPAALPAQIDCQGDRCSFDGAFLALLCLNDSCYFLWL